MKKTLRLVALYVRLGIASALEYRASFFMAAAGMLLSNASFVFFWAVAFAQSGGPIGGYDFRDVMFIWAASSAAYGASNIVFGNMGRLPEAIAKGELDAFLLQPRNPLLSFLLSRTDVTAFGDLAYGFVLMALSGQDARAWALFLCAIALGGALYTASGVMFGSLTFWLGDAGGTGDIALNVLINFCNYPEGIYPRAVRAFMYTLIPAAFVVHVPLKLARGAGMGWLAVWPLFTACYCALAYWMFRRGLRRYESGNLVTTRL